MLRDKEGRGDVTGPAISRRQSAARPALLQEWDQTRAQSRCRTLVPFRFQCYFCVCPKMACRMYIMRPRQIP